MKRRGLTARYEGAPAPLDVTARAPLWEERRSELGSLENLDELADLVDAFYDEEGKDRDGGREDESDSGSDGKSKGWRETLEAALAESEADMAAEPIRVETERAVRAVGSDADGLKRRVMSWLRDRGFDAGLCKSSWERIDGVPAGHHEYIDLIVEGGSRYILEINLAAEFKIARPTTDYVTLLGALPVVYVGRPEVLKGIIKLMCSAVKESMRSAGMHMPPWRRRQYMQGKWLSAYKRTTVEREESNDRAMVATGVMRSRGCSMSQKFCGMKFRRMELPVDERKWTVVFRGL